MAVLIPDGYAQVTLNWTNVFTSRVYSTVLGVKQDDATADEIGETVSTAWSTSLKDPLDASISLSTLTIRVGPSTGPDPGLAIDYPVNLPGNEAMSGVPCNSALLVKKLTAFGGRANRGRNYWPGLLAEGNVDEVGNVESSHVSYLQGIFLDFFGKLGSGNDVTTSPCPLVILHDETSPTTTPRLVVAVQVQPLIATQRRRVRP